MAFRKKEAPEDPHAECSRVEADLKAEIAGLQADLKAARDKPARCAGQCPNVEADIAEDIKSATDTVKYQAKTAWSALKTWRDAKERAARGERVTTE